MKREKQGFLERISCHTLKFHDVYLIHFKLGASFHLERFKLSTLDHTFSKYFLNKRDFQQKKKVVVYLADEQ